MRATQLLIDGFDRVRDGVERLLQSVDGDRLGRAPVPGANPAGWLVWHLVRVQDDHVSTLAGTQQVWLDGWYERSGLELAATDTGYGHGPEQVLAVRLDAQFLRGYSDAVHARTTDVLEALADADLERVVDESYDPPVTAAVRWVSVLEDDLQHLGQAAYVRGLLDRDAG